MLRYVSLSDNYTAEAYGDVLSKCEPYGNIRYVTMEGDLELDADCEPREGRWRDVIGRLRYNLAVHVHVGLVQPHVHESIHSIDCYILLRVNTYCLVRSTTKDRMLVTHATIGFVHNSPK